MNVEKMRRNLARGVPDAVWRTFDPRDNRSWDQIEEWRDHWLRMMKIKHGQNAKDFTISRSDQIDGNIRFQLVVNLRRNKL